VKTLFIFIYHGFRIPPLSTNQMQLMLRLRVFTSVIITYTVLTVFPLLEMSYKTIFPKVHAKRRGKTAEATERQNADRVFKRRGTLSTNQRRGKTALDQSATGKDRTRKWGVHSEFHTFRQTEGPTPFALTVFNGSV